MDCAKREIARWWIGGRSVVVMTTGAAQALDDKVVSDSAPSGVDLGPRLLCSVWLFTCPHGAFLDTFPGALGNREVSATQVDGTLSCLVSDYFVFVGFFLSCVVGSFWEPGRRLRTGTRVGNAAWGSWEAVSSWWREGKLCSWTQAWASTAAIAPENYRLSPCSLVGATSNVMSGSFSRAFLIVKTVEAHSHEHLGMIY